MAEQFPESVVAKVIDRLTVAALGALITWLTAGSTGVVGLALVTLLSILGGGFSLIYRFYVGVLGAGTKREGSPDRQAYDGLRKSLDEGGSAALLYAQRVSGFLDTVDRFFGDAGMANQTLFPRAFGLRTPASLWTAPAFDRCMLLALFYQVAMIFVIWAISGHVGSAEAALYLQPDLSGWQRGLAAAVAGSSIFTFWCCMRTGGWKFLAWGAVASAFGFAAGAAAGAAAVALPAAVALAVAFDFAGPLAGAGTVALALAGTVALAVAGAGTVL